MTADLERAGYDQPPPRIEYGPCTCPRCTYRRKRDPWAIAWGLWVIAFLLIEVPAAIKERAGGARTLSRHVWRWYAGWKRIPLGIFLLVLSLHFLLGAGHWFSGAPALIVTAVPVALLFAVGVVHD